MPDAKEDARWPEAILLTVALWLFILLIFMPAILERHAGDSWMSIALDSCTVFVSMIFALPLFSLFRATIGWPPPARILILVAGVIFTAILNRTFDILWTGWVSENLQTSWAHIPESLQSNYNRTFNYIMVFAVNLALFQLSFARRREQRQARQLTDARSAAQQAQLAALRYQLNPHFLFNTLNSISALIVTKRNDDAERMTDKLSSFLRSSLACDPGELIPLEEELAMLEEYLDIEGVRFGERLNVEINCEPHACEALIPGFLVQPLVENAIKHGVAPSREPVNISVKAALEDSKLCITVENDKCAKAKPAHSGRTGVGLENIRRRLEAVYGKKASLSIEPGEKTFTATICIPEIEQAR